MTAMAGHDRHLATCADHLQSAIDGDKIVFHVMQGLRHLMAAVAPGDAPNPDLSSEVSRLLFALAPGLSAAVAGHLTAEHAHFALGCANAALTCRDPQRLRSLLAYIAVFEAELKAIYFRHYVASGEYLDLAAMIVRNTPTTALFLREPPPVQ